MPVQLELDFNAAMDVKQWHPADAKTGDQFVIRLHTGLWETVMFIDGEYHRSANDIVDRCTVSHWARLPDF